MLGFVYLWRNKINGKKYIGLHFGLPTDGYVGSGVMFKKSIAKWGLVNFERTILYEEYESAEKLYQKEFEIINLVNAVHSSEYYNLSNFDPKGVKFCGGKRTRIVSEISREKLRIYRTGTKATLETREKMSKIRKGRPSSLKGKPGATIGSINGQYGKKWYTDGVKSATFLPGSEPSGWTKGRICPQMMGINNPFYGKTHSAETRQRIKDTLSLTNHSGANNAFYGHRHSAETKLKMCGPPPPLTSKKLKKDIANENN